MAVPFQTAGGHTTGGGTVGGIGGCNDTSGDDDNAAEVAGRWVLLPSSPAAAAVAVGPAATCRLGGFEATSLARFRPLVAEAGSCGAPVVAVCVAALIDALESVPFRAVD